MLLSFFLWLARCWPRLLLRLLSRHKTVHQIWYITGVWKFCCCVRATTNRYYFVRHKISSTDLFFPHTHTEPESESQRTSESASDVAHVAATANVNNNHYKCKPLRHLHNHCKSGRIFEGTRAICTENLRSRIHTFGVSFRQVDNRNEWKKTLA